jgi:protein TonB
VNPAVDQILAERERQPRPGVAVASVLGAAVLHGAVLASIFLLGRLTPPAQPPDYVAVQLVPLQRLGATQPVHRTRPTPPRPAESEPPPPPSPPKALPKAAPPPQPEEPPVPARSNDAPPLPKPVPVPKPPRTAKPPAPAPPQPPKPDTRYDPTTRPKVIPPPREVLAHKLGPAAVVPPAASGPAGGTTGSAAGTVTVGSSTAALDNPDFTYDYYIAQLVSRIEQNWTSTPVGKGVFAIVSFRITKTGAVTDVKVSRSSGLETFDLAAQRAVQNASPFPPLPRAYTSDHDSVGVNVTLRPKDLEVP